jgi:hypothetical protein
MPAALESLASLLRAKKLDVTLTSMSSQAPVAADRLASTGDADLDASLGGGLRRGNQTQFFGAHAGGRTTVMTRALAAAAERGDAVALIDACDTFDPASAAAQGLDVSHLLWVRESGDASRALKAFSLVLQAGGFGVVVFDLADVALPALRRFPWYKTTTTWMRLARIVEGSDTVALLVGSERIARSAGGVTIALESSPARWQGAASRARLFTGVRPAPRVVRARS